MESSEPNRATSEDGTVIRSTADRIANEANIAAIDKLIGPTKFTHIVAWGKCLGFTPETVYSGPQKLDRQPRNSFLFKGGFCHGQERRQYGPSFKARMALQAIRKRKGIHPITGPFGSPPAVVPFPRPLEKDDGR